MPAQFCHALGGGQKDVLDNATSSTLRARQVFDDQLWCHLRVVKRDGLLLSLDNRRLWSLKEAQRKMRMSDPEPIVWVRASRDGRA